MNRLYISSFTIVEIETGIFQQVRRYQEAIKQNGGEVVFVKLFCPPEILEQRVLSLKRKNWKISSLAGLALALDNTDLTNEIPSTKITIDTYVFEPT